jgi:hypothetical protein
VVREGVGQGGEMTQALYAHMNNKKKNYSKGGEAIKENDGGGEMNYNKNFCKCHNIPPE